MKKGSTYILNKTSSSSSWVLASTCSVSLTTGSNWGSCSSVYLFEYRWYCDVMWVERVMKVRIWFCPCPFRIITTKYVILCIECIHRRIIQLYTTEMERGETHVNLFSGIGHCIWSNLNYFFDKLLHQSSFNLSFLIDSRLSSFP